MKKLIIIFGIVIFFGLVVEGINYFFEKFPPKQNLIETQTTYPFCLKDDEVATFQFRGNRTTATSADVIIKNKITNEELFRFLIDDLVPHYYSYEFHKCGTYVIRQFNYDPKKTKQDPGYRKELWKYDYGGNGEPLLLLAEKPKDFILYYESDFRIDPQETYVALIQVDVREGDLETPNYALVIRNLHLERNDFLLLRKDLAEEHPEFTGLFSLRTWTKDGSYFWADLFIAAKVEAFLRIIRDVWEIDLLPVPAETEGGTALNPEMGYITYDTGPSWVGIDIIQEEIKKEWQKANKVASFYLYNLFSKERILLATTTDPFWPFKPRWLSDTELQYELPTGEKKTYKIEE